MAMRRTDPAKLAELDIRWVDTAELKYDKHNARRHNERNLDMIEGSLQQFGQRKPLVVSKDMTVVAGNGTLQVMRDRLQIERVCVSVFPGTAAEAKAYGIADNRTGELASWDSQLLADSLAQFDGDLLAAAGFNREELDDLQAMIRPSPPPDPRGYFEEPTQLPADDDHDDRYAARAQWTLFYDYPNAVYVWLIEQLAAYRAEHGLETNTDAVIAIAEAASGDPAPAAG